jgi:N-methylhydantoinase A
VGSFDALDRRRLRAVAAELTGQGRAALEAQGVAPECIQVALAGDVRYVGQYHEITVPWAAEEVEAGDLTGLGKRFHATHERLYGYALPDAPLELVNLRATATGSVAKPPLPELPAGPAPAPRARRAAWVAEEARFVDTPVYDGEACGRGARLCGPALIELPATTVVVPPGWRVEVDAHGAFLLERA